MIHIALSPKEHFRLHGSLPAAVIESLIDATEVFTGGDAIDTALVKVQEARGCFPGEDCLAPIIDRLRLMGGRVRGDNKKEVQGLIEAMDDLQMCLFNQGDYGRSELRDAERALLKLKGK